MNIYLLGSILILLITASFAKDEKNVKQSKKRNAGFFSSDFISGYPSINTFDHSAFGLSSFGNGYEVGYPNYFYSGEQLAPSYSTEVSGHSISHSPASALVASAGIGSFNEQRVVTQHVPVPVPQPYPVTVVKKVPVPKPYIVEVPKVVPYAVPIKVPVEIPKPYAVKVPHHVPVAVKVKYPVEIPKPYPVTHTKKIEVPVEKPVYVSEPHPVKVPVPQPYTVNVPQPVEVKVPHPVIVKVPQVIYGDNSFFGQGSIQGIDTIGNFDFTQGFQSGFGDISSFPSGISGFGEIGGIQGIQGGISDVSTLPSITQGISSTTTSSILGENVDEQSDSISIEAKSGVKSDAEHETSSTSATNKPEETETETLSVSNAVPLSAKEGIVAVEKPVEEVGIEESTTLSLNVEDNVSTDKPELSTSAIVEEASTIKD